MTTKILTNPQAEKRFYGKLNPDNYGHKIEIRWTGKKREGWNRSGTPSPRDELNVWCVTCGRSLRNWGTTYTNADGTIPVGDLTTANYHLIMQKPDETVDIEAEKVMIVHMKRGNKQTEFWVAHYRDDDFWEACFPVKQITHSNYRGSKAEPYLSAKKDSRGNWHRLSFFSSRDEAVGFCTKQKQKYETKGYKVELLDHTSSGHVPPAATVAISVKKLINEYKDLRTNATPIEHKAWVDKVADALTNMELLRALYEEAQGGFAESLEL